MFRLVSIFSMLCLTLTSHSQNTNISGVINTYYSVNNINNNTITIPTSSALNIGDKVLIIQMQGATINISNTSAFGTVSALNNVGNYEFTTICSIPNSTEIEVNNIQRNYSTSGIVQLIHVPIYDDATITATLTADPWDGLVGGVLAFECSGTLTMASDIDLSGLGFRGGDISTSGYNCSWFTDVDNYFYNITSGEGAKKGEGIAFYINNSTGGRGPQANGGGGGNDHNSGGGGGGNAGNGGLGGERIKPSTFTCGGSNPGMGGIMQIYSNAANTVFLGGGGGSGHENNSNTATDGTNGGGIVMITAQNILSSGQTINVSGKTQVSNSADGAGGGGAGGSVLLDIISYSGNLNINVSGGNGGHVSNIGPSNCNGPGGGGSGGVVWVSQTTIPSNINSNISGGTFGTTLNTTQPNCTINGANNATAGDNGLTLSGLIFPQPQCSIPPITDNLSICAGDSTYLQGSWRDTAGIYYDTLSGSCCDTIVQTTLSINSILSDTINPIICFGDSIVVNGTIYNTSVTGANEVFSNIGPNNCDSVVTINLTVLPQIIGMDNISECNSYTWIDSNTYTANNNTASYTIENGASNGCDSTVMLNLTINTIDITTTSAGATISANAAGVMYRWLDCDTNFAVILGETGQTFTPVSNGNYAVEVTDNNCTDTSVCQIVNTIGILENNQFNQAVIYPNPTSKNVHLVLREAEEFSLVVSDLTGKTIYQACCINSKTYDFELNTGTGAYYISLISDKANKTLKLIIQ